MDIKIKFEIEIAGQTIVLTKEEFDELKKKMNDIERSFSTLLPSHVGMPAYIELLKKLYDKNNTYQPKDYSAPAIASLPWHWDKDTLTSGDPIWIVDFETLPRY